MANDVDVAIRRIVAQRMDEEDLQQISQDEDWTVRYKVALRVPPALLEQMLDDPEEEVRLIAKQRWEALSAKTIHHE